MMLHAISSPGNYTPLGKKAGEIQLIVGPMFSGKTSELLRRIRRYTVAKRACIVIKYQADQRYSKDAAASHDKLTHAAVPAKALRDVDVSSYDVVGVDEGQFYPDLLEVCEELASQGKVVVVAALDATFQRKPFGQVLDLIPLSESVVKLHAVCMVCQAPASFTSRLSADTQERLIGGTDTYIATCRSCFHAKEQRGPLTCARRMELEEKTPTVQHDGDEMVAAKRRKVALLVSTDSSSSAAAASSSSSLEQQQQPISRQLILPPSSSSEEELPLSQ